MWALVPRPSGIAWRRRAAAAASASSAGTPRMEAVAVGQPCCDLAGSTRCPRSRCVRWHFTWSAASCAASSVVERPVATCSVSAAEGEHQRRRHGHRQRAASRRATRGCASPPRMRLAAGRAAPPGAGLGKQLRGDARSSRRARRARGGALRPSRPGTRRGAHPRRRGRRRRSSPSTHGATGGDQSHAESYVWSSVDRVQPAGSQPVRVAPPPWRSSCSNSSRRPREMRDITVPAGMSSIAAISAYENSSTSRSQTACAEGVGQRVERGLEVDVERRIEQQLLRASQRVPGSASAPARPTSLSTSTGSRAASRAAVAQVFIRIVNSHARRFVPRSNRPADRNALRTCPGRGLPPPPGCASGAARPGTARPAVPAPPLRRRSGVATAARRRRNGSTAMRSAGA